jgi:GT2 family glycosyltransferase
MEFNLRLKRAGFKTLLVPNIVSYYYADPDLRSFLRHNFINGRWAILPFRYSNIIPVSLRHVAPLEFVLALISIFTLSLFLPFFWWVFLLITASYLLTNLLFSTIITVKEKDLRYALMMPMVFLLLHIPYGAGSLFGVIGLFFPQREKC